MWWKEVKNWNTGFAKGFILGNMVWSGFALLVLGIQWVLETNSAWFR